MNTASKAQLIVNNMRAKGTVMSDSKNAIFEKLLVKLGPQLARVDIFYHCIDFKDGSLIVFKDGINDWYVQTQNKRG